MHKLPSSSERLFAHMERTHRPAHEWSQPERFDLGSIADQNELNRRFESGKIAATVDRTSDVANEIFDHLTLNPEFSVARSDFVDDYVSRQDSVPFVMPWRKELWLFPSEDSYPSIRSSRYNPLITPEEQARVGKKVTTMVAGLSVGSAIEDSLVLSGVGDRHIIVDFDHLSLTNTGRVSSRYDEIGGLKADNKAIKTSELNPFIEQVVIRKGLDQTVLNWLIEKCMRPDVMFDAVDDFGAKIQMRRFAKNHGIPLVMVTDLGERSMVDIENYSTDPRSLFNGRLSEALIQKIQDGTISDKERKIVFKNLLGITNLSPRLMKSSVMSDRGEIGGVPQDGLIAGVGGSVGAFIARQILLGRSTKSGRHVIDLAKLLDLRSANSMREEALMVVDALKHTYL